MPDVSPNPTRGATMAVAAGSQLAAEAGAAMAHAGGNAIDAAIAATFVLMISEPGVCAPGAGGFLTIRMPDCDPITVDANVAMPGRGVDPNRFGTATRSITMEYGGGVSTTIGYESVGVPGGIAGLGLAWDRWGRASWADLLAPAIDLARAGAPLSRASHLYLEYTHESIFGWDSRSHAAIHRADGSLLEVGELITVEGLAATLEHLAIAGPEDAYRGDLAAVLAADLDAGGSLVTAEDLANYEPTVRPSLRRSIGSWDVATNPPPSIGGATLAAMLELASARDQSSVSITDLVASQEKILRYRSSHLDNALDLEAATQALLDTLAKTGALHWLSSPSTVHSSAVDRDGSACAITMSAGYGSGVVAGSSGFWMNNSLGEVELNRRGYHQLAVGERLPSNMAPTIATRSDGALLAIGSPGADRITTALQQVLLRVIAGEDLQSAVDAPRLHVETGDDTSVVAFEHGLQIPDTMRSREFNGPHMFFGCVAAAMYDPADGLAAGADDRRDGGVAFV